MMKIYTKSGDDGSTGLIGGRRVPKNDLRIEAYGTIDELNSWIGKISDGGILAEQDVLMLRQIQHQLFVIGALLASDPDNSQFPVPQLDSNATEILEQEIDRHTAALEPLTNFILPGGHPAVSDIHIGRCVARRAERITVALHQVATIDEHVLHYLNRLSDYLFTLARYVARSEGAAEIKWEPRKKSR